MLAYLTRKFCASVFREMFIRWLLLYFMGHFWLLLLFRRLHGMQVLEEDDSENCEYVTEEVVVFAKLIRIRKGLQREGKGHVVD